MLWPVTGRRRQAVLRFPGVGLRGTIRWEKRKGSRQKTEQEEKKTERRKSPWGSVDHEHTAMRLAW